MKMPCALLHKIIGIPLLSGYVPARMKKKFLWFILIRKSLKRNESIYACPCDRNNCVIEADKQGEFVANLDLSLLDV